MPSFITLGWVWQILGRGAFLPSHSWAASKRSILNRVKVTKKENLTRMFSLACNLLKIDAYSDDFGKIFLAKNPCDCNQIRSNQISVSANALNHLFFQSKGIKDNYWRYQLVRCYDISKTLVSFRYQLKCLCDVLSWSVSLSYRLVHRYTSQIGRFYLRTSETSQNSLK